VVESRLKSIECDAPVTYSTNRNQVSCKIECQSLDQRNRVYDAFRDMPKYGLTATKEPPAVTVILVLDPLPTIEEAERAALDRMETRIRGTVLQKIDDGLLVKPDKDDHVVLIADGPSSKVDDDAISVSAYYMSDFSDFQYTTSQGAKKTVRKFTCDRSLARQYWAE